MGAVGILFLQIFFFFFFFPFLLLGAPGCQWANAPG